jgi:serine/threonine protein kinase
LRFRHFKVCVVDLSGYEAGSVIGQRDRVVTQVHHRRCDGILIVVKTISLPVFIELCQSETEIENQMNLRHPVITSLIGCDFRVESSGVIEMKAVRSHAEATDGSLVDVVMNPPVWWTPTVKVKTLVGIALGLRYAHGHGLLHGSVKASNIIFDANHRIQIVDFSPIRLENESVEPFSGAGGAELDPTVDISGFASLLAEIGVNRIVNSSIGSMEDSLHHSFVPDFVLEIIEAGQSPKSPCQVSFINIFSRLKANDFRILSGIDPEEVSAFVRWVESSEETGEWEYRHTQQIHISHRW